MIKEFLSLFFTILIILDPIGVVPPFMATTAMYEPKTQVFIIKRAVIVAGAVFLFFILFGRLILEFFGISVGAFYISGGILFFMISFEMIWSKPSNRRTPDSPQDRPDAKVVAVFPLAIPLIAGPGMITTIMLTMADFSSWLRATIELGIAISLGLTVNYITLRGGRFLLKVIGQTGMYVVEKIMGLILAGLSVQLIYEGLIKLGIIALP